MASFAAIEISDLHFHYPDGRVALQDIQLRVEAGERVALVGPNGAGKSTLLLHLNGILRGEGQLRIQGLTMQPDNLRRIRALVGLVFQDPDDQLFSPTVFDDVAFGPLYMGLSPTEVQQRALRSLALVGMEAYARRTSHHLSVGEKKRVAIATVLSMEPPILALDEPTAGLDPGARRRLIQLLSGLPQTLILSTHDLHLVAELCPRMVILDAGRVVADGPTPSLLADARLLAAHQLSESQPA